jgi:hypothetical protein
MKYYLKVGNNTRVLQPGDYFIGADGLNHNYTEATIMTTPDRVATGVHELSEDDIDYERIYSESGIQARLVEEYSIMKTIEGFYFRGDQYNCSVREMTLMSLLLSIANTKTADNIGDLNWLNDNIPFYIHTTSGVIRNFDLSTLKIFVQEMTYYVMACKTAAELLKFKITLGEIDPSDSINWPDTTTSTSKFMYEEFTRRYIEAKFSNTDGVYIDPNPPLDVQSSDIFSIEPSMTFEEIETILNELNSNGA